MCCISGRASLRVAVVLLASIAAAWAKHYRAEGVVLAIDSAHQTVTISHRAIPHYMEAMVMPFTARDPRDLAGLTPGVRITFSLDAGRKSTRISDIRRVPTGIDDVPVVTQSKKLTVGEKVPDFSLKDQRNQAVHLSDFLGRPVVLDFIYTRCPLPDVCPRLSANMARLQKRFGSRLTLISITLDPQFDTPQVLEDYARRWQADSGNWRFLTGGEDEIRAVAAHFGLVYWAEEGLITHTAVTAIIDSHGKLAAMLEGSRFTSQQLLDLTTTTLGLPIQPQAPGLANSPAR